MIGSDRLRDPGADAATAFEAAPGGGLRVLRLCSVFEPPVSVAELSGRSDPIGGMQNHTGALTRALDRLGVAQDVVTTRLPGAPSEEAFGRSATIHRVGTRVPRPRRLYSVPASRLAPALARDADLVHAHLGEDLAVLPIAATASARRSIPLVVTIHCSLEHTLRSVDLRTAMLRVVGAPIERWGTRRADAIITLTERLRARLVSAGADPRSVHVIPSGVEPHLFAVSGERPLAELRGPRIVFVGRLTRAKGVETLLEAFARVRTAGAHLVYVGDGPDRASLERAIADRNLGDRVRITGFVRHDEVPSQLAHADVLALPSAYEELGSILLEAMEAGVPVVASRTGGIPDLVDHGSNGLLVHPGAPDQLAMAIDGVLGDEVLASALRSGGRQTVRSHRWDRLAGRVLEVYRGCAVRA